MTWSEDSQNSDNELSQDDESSSKEVKPLVTEEEERLLRFYNPSTGKCDLSEEGVRQREAYDRAASEAAERQRQDRLEQWRKSLDPETEQALGTLSPEFAWSLVVDQCFAAMEMQPEASLHVGEEMGIFNHPDDPHPLRYLDDIRDLLVSINPSSGAVPS